MDDTKSIDLSQLASQLRLPVQKVQATVELLDAGNTVPFITRFRKDRTGGLDEEQVRDVQATLDRQRALDERKHSVLRSIESQGRLSPELAAQINSVQTVKRLEDLYLPFKSKKQTWATMARERGLEVLAREILDGAPAAVDLLVRAAQLISAEKELPDADKVLQGVGHLLAEEFGDNAELRGRLRGIVEKTGQLVCSKVERPAPPPRSAHNLAEREPGRQQPETPAEVPPAAPFALQATASPPALEPTGAGDTPSAEEPPAGSFDQDLSEVVRESIPGEPIEPQPIEPQPIEQQQVEQQQVEQQQVEQQPIEQQPIEQQQVEQQQVEQQPIESEPIESEPIESQSSVEQQPIELRTSEETVEQQPVELAAEGVARQPSVSRRRESSMSAHVGQLRDQRRASREAQKAKKRHQKENAFKDYFNYRDPLSKIPPHRILAINRGERSGVLRVRIEADMRAMLEQLESMVVPADHPHADFLRQSAKDALQRLIWPSLEREMRRELTDKAEAHATQVFARNLRTLLLQPPVRNHRVLALDPGFKNGCKLAALDEFGNLLCEGLIHVVGRDDRRQRGRELLAQLIREHNITLVAIGNGTACREAEQFVSSVFAEELADREIAYVIVNEAGTSVYSTSAIGREELPDADPLCRSAISIGRRLLDPLSELVKVNPANIGVGMYQHDVKMKQLRESLDKVVESCVNYVGVDVNTASPALLGYVSGLNQPTARRIYEYRLANGPFANREQLKQVPGLGEATFVQSAGFLRIRDGDNPLDNTWIHPESYDVARRVLQRLNSSVQELATGSRRSAPSAQPTATSSVPPATAGSTNEHVQPDESPTCHASPPMVSRNGSLSAAGEEAEVPLSLAGSTAIEDELGGGSSRTTMVAERCGSDEMKVSDDTQEVDEVAARPPLDRVGFTDGSDPAAPTSKGDVTGRTLVERCKSIEIDALAAELQIGRMTLQDILFALTRPGRDPRDDLPPPMFRKGIMKLEDLEPGMELSGSVLNVVDFGVFVDIGLSDSGLVHISRLADRFVRDPHEVVAVGDQLRVWVVDVDKQRRRVSLTAIQPGTERPPAERPPRGHRSRPPKQSPPATAGQRGDKRRRDADRKRGGGKPAPAARKAPSRPVTPITQEMVDGKEPMRSFADLLQYYEKKKPDGDEPAK